MKTQTIKQYKTKAAGLDPVVRIGKNGISSQIISDLKKHLDKRKLIKVKLLKAFPEYDKRKSVAAEIATQTNAELIQLIGGVIVLAKKESGRT